MTTVFDVANYIITSLTEGSDRKIIDNLKLQKLLYYCKAWHLAIFKNSAGFPGTFEAWIHGPVSRELFNACEDKTLFGVSGFFPQGNVANVTDDQRLHIDEVLAVYGSLSGFQLEDMTHRERPWIVARGDLAPHEYCTTVINDNDMMAYYEPSDS